MAVNVQVPHGMAWCTGGKRVVQAEGATVGEMWADLSANYQELMWRLSTEDGKPIRWVRIALDGQKVPQDDGLLGHSLEGITVVTLTVMEVAPAAAPMGGKNPF